MQASLEDQKRVLEKIHSDEVGALREDLEHEYATRLDELYDVVQERLVGAMTATVEKLEAQNAALKVRGTACLVGSVTRRLIAVGISLLVQTMARTLHVLFC